MIGFLIKRLDIRGGDQKQFIKLLQYVSKKTDDFCIITTDVDFEKGFDELKSFKDKIRIFKLYPKTGNRIKNKLILLKEKKQLKELTKDIDIVNVHNTGYEPYFSVFKRKRLVWQVNDLPSCFRVGIDANKNVTWREKRAQYLQKKWCKNVNIFTVNVSKNKDRIYDAYHRDAIVLYCGIDPVDVKIETEKTLKRFKNKEIRILSTGIFMPYRNYETSVRVIDELRKKGINARLDIIGSDTGYGKDYSDYIKELVKKLELEEFISIHGQVDEEKFRSLHKDSDIFMFINIDQSWGLAVFEAMSAGLPVIVSESVGASEILNNGVDSIIVNPTDVESINNEIYKLMHDDEYYKKLSEKALGFHKAYTWDNAYSSKAYELLIDK